MRQSEMLTVRVRPGDVAALDALAKRTSQTRAALLRAGLRAITVDPHLLVDAPSGPATPEVGVARVERAYGQSTELPPSPSKGGKRSRPRNRRRKR